MEETFYVSTSVALRFCINLMDRPSFTPHTSQQEATWHDCGKTLNPKACQVHLLAFPLAMEEVESMSHTEKRLEQQHDELLRHRVLDMSRTGGDCFLKVNRMSSPYLGSQHVRGAYICIYIYICACFAYCGNRTLAKPACVSMWAR